MLQQHNLVVVLPKMRLQCVQKVQVSACCNVAKWVAICLYVLPPRAHPSLNVMKTHIVLHIFVVSHKSRKKQDMLLNRQKVLRKSLGHLPLLVHLTNAVLQFLWLNVVVWLRLLLHFVSLLSLGGSISSLPNGGSGAKKASPTIYVLLSSQ